jgi:putative ABC transport system permease protein
VTESVSIPRQRVSVLPSCTCIVSALSKYGLVFALPYKSPAACVAVAIFAGMLAAILPARCASKLNVLEALQYE